MCQCMPIRCAQCLVIFTSFIMISASVVSIAGAVYSYKNQYFQGAHINLNISVPIFIFAIASLIVSAIGVIGGFFKHKVSIYAFSFNCFAMIISLSAVAIFTSVEVQHNPITQPAKSITQNQSLNIKKQQNNPQQSIDEMYKIAEMAYEKRKCPQHLKNYQACLAKNSELNNLQQVDLKLADYIGYIQSSSKCSGLSVAMNKYYFSNHSKTLQFSQSCYQSMSKDRWNSRNVVCGMLGTVIILAAFAFVSTIIIIFHPRATKDFFRESQGKKYRRLT